MNPVLTLVKAKAKIKQGWTQGAYARDRHGRERDEKDPRACRWCMWGALLVANPNDHGSTSAAFEALDDIVKQEAGPEGGILLFNDTKGRKKSEVLAMFDKAIIKCVTKGCE